MGVFTTAAKTWGAEALKSSDLNAQVRDFITGFNGTSQAWTPTITGWTGSYTATARYAQIQKLVWFRLLISCTGSGSTYPTAPTFTLPVAATSFFGNYYYAGSGTASLNHVGTNVWMGSWYISSSTTAVIGGIGTNGAAANLTSTYPFTWASGDFITVNGFYEAA